MAIYRTATGQDVPALAELRWDFRFAEAGGCAAHSKAEFMNVCTEFFESALKRGDWTCWVAEENGRLIACICVYTIRKIPNPNSLYPTFGYVSNVYTRSEARNLGVGSELMRHVIAWARDQQFEDLTLWPSEQSVPFYERAGFLPDNHVLTLLLDTGVDQD